ncbi:MAG TPA: hypothetical protein VEW28_10615 [Candidatus Kapabacteria bacterium]|nr:hypothetical protein [Candidatus Kapabacteria bacterium]
MKDGSAVSVVLLSVREHSIVVSSYDSQDFHIDSAISSAFVIPFEKIRDIKEVSVPGIAPIAIGVASGFVVGAFVDEVRRPVAAAGESRSILAKYTGTLIGSVAGLVSGLFYNQRTITSYSLDRPEDIASLHQAAVYQNGEPPDLERIH